MAGIPYSITASGKYEPFELQVARGQIMGHEPINVFGYSTSVGSTALGPLWEGLTASGGAYVYPGSAAPLVLTSSSASDTSALSVTIDGCGSNFARLKETIALNGTSNVTTTNSFLRINNMYTSNGLNVGTITAKISSTTYAQINAGIGQSQMSIYTVPAGYTLYLTSIQADANIGFTSSSYMTYAEYNKDNVNGDTSLVNQSTFVQNLNIPFSCPLVHTEKTDIQFQVKAYSGSNGIANIYAGGILIANTV